MRTRILGWLAISAALAVGGTAVSCGGGSGGAGPLVLVGFNLPNIAGVALDQPLIYTFSDNIDPASVTPDTIQVTGPAGFGFTFETIVVDGNLVAELPRLPRFDDYTDGGMFAGKTYNVFLPIFPAVDTVRSVSGGGLVKAESFNFTTTPVVSFVEPRRPLSHTPGPISGPNLKGDEDGCLNNSEPAAAAIYVFPGFQFGTDADAKLLCIKNEGSPHVLNSISIPTFDQRAVGTPSAVQPGFLDMPAVRVRFNEPIDPATATPYVPTTQLSINVQLWRVADTDAVPLPGGPEQILTNKPVCVQDLSQTEVILVAVGPQKQGTYLVAIHGIKDLAGNPLFTADSPPLGPNSPLGYASIPASLIGKVAPGYRIFFRTLELGTLPGSITENFGDNFDEQTNGLFTNTVIATNPRNNIPSSPSTGAVGFTLQQAAPTTSTGQATNADWNMSHKYAGLPGANMNTNQDDGAGRLKAVFEPFLGNGTDGNLVVTPVGNTLFSTGGANGNGLYEFESVTIQAGSTLTLAGPKPVVILCRGAFVVNGTITASGTNGGFGCDTDGSNAWWHDDGSGPTSGSIPSSGAGGAGGPGGGAGGHGAPTSSGTPAAGAGNSGTDRWGGVFVAGVGAAGTNADATNKGGGAGGYGTAGVSGAGAAASGVAYGISTFERALALFTPDRNYEPSTGIIGGAGGGGGGADDDSVTSGGGTASAMQSETGDGSFPMLATGQSTGADDCGGGGGGGGGALWVQADSISVSASGQILANGGRGGNTYAAADQIIVVTPPIGMSPGSTDVTGVTNPNAAGSGSGGGGGGGSGGAILLQARTSLSVAAGGVVSAIGGVGGTTGGGTKNGGAGGAGRIGLMSFMASGESAAGSFSVLGTVTPAAGAGASGAVWAPTTDLTSSGVSFWYDQVTATAAYGIVPPGFLTDDNFAQLQAAPYSLVRGLANDFEATVEFQGADTLTPAIDVQNATGGSGITQWSTTITSINTKRFFRWRWRFFVKKGYPQATAPMPQLLSFTVPFSK